MTESLRIILLSDSAHPGEQHQALGIARAFERRADEQLTLIDMQEWDVATLAAKLREVQPDTRTVFIGVGESGIAALPAIKQAYRQNAVTVWAGHTALNGLEASAPMIDFLALPEHLILPKSLEYREQQGTLCRTQGVAHDLTPQALVDAHALLLTATAIPRERVLAVALGGSDTTNGEEHVFTPLQAEALGFALGREALQEGKSVVYTGSPRTTTGMLQAFEKGLAESGLQQRHVLASGPAGTSTRDDYLALMSIVANDPASRFTVTADSVTMMSEATLLPPERVRYVRTSATTAENAACAVSLAKNGHGQAFHIENGALVEEGARGVKAHGGGLLDTAREIAEKALAAIRHLFHRDGADRELSDARTHLTLDDMTRVALTH